jgi:hypothetical protein
MSKGKITPVSLAFLLLGLALGLTAQTADFAGTWLGKTEIPDVGVDELTLVLEKTPTGYKGKVSDTLGMLTPETELRDVQLTGNEIACSCFLADGAEVKFKLKFEGDKMTGIWEHQAGGVGTLEFARKKI